MDLFIDVAGGAKRGVTRYALPTRRAEAFRFYLWLYKLSSLLYMYSNTRHVSSLHISDRYQTHMTVHMTTSTGS